MRLSKLAHRDQRFRIRKIVKNPRLIPVKVATEFNETFSTSVSLETVRGGLRSAGLKDVLSVKNFLLVRKTGSLGFPSQNQ